MPVGDLFITLDGWDIANPPPEIRTAVDPRRTLSAYQEAADSGEHSQACEILETEIQRLRPLLRAHRMGALQLDPSSEQHIDVADYLAHLHICATTLALEQGDATVARAHTLKSLVVSPENVQPRLSLIELYARTECRREARFLQGDCAMLGRLV